MLTTPGGASPDSGIPTPDELHALSQWYERAFPPQGAPLPSPAGGLQVLESSHKTVLGHSVLGTAIKLGETTFRHGIGVDAPHRMAIMLPRPARRFLSTVGIDDNPDTRFGSPSGGGSCTFHVISGGTELTRTEVLTLATGPQTLDVPLAGATSLELVVDAAGDRGWDQAAWADARIEYEDGSVEFVDDSARAQSAEVSWPFSFTYRGLPSRALLLGWSRTVTDSALPDGRTRRTTTYADPESGLVCEAQTAIGQGEAGVEWVLEFRNEGSDDTGLLEDIGALDATWAMPAASPVTLHRWRGGECAPTAFAPLRDSLDTGTALSFAPQGGRSSDGLLPFFQLEWPGGGLTIAIGWSGQWRAQVSRVGPLRVSAGLEKLRTVLHPGESIRTPRILVVPWAEGDRQRGWNLYRRMAVSHYMPRIEGQLAFPVIAHDSAYDELRNANETNQLEIIAACKRLGLEGYWMDAYWFEGYFPEGVGNWALPPELTERKADFPSGVRALSDAAHQAGLKFVLWFEPERVAPGTRIDREHPQWILRAPSGGDGLLDLGNPEARQWMTDYLCRCVEAYDLDVLRIDFNIAPLPHWRAADPPSREGITEIRYVTGLYRMWDDIRERFPRLLIDNCASGGRRIDLETNTRSLPLWRSDHNDNNQVQGDTTADQSMTMGLTPFMPLNAGPVWRADPYYWRCASVGGPVPYWDPRGTTYLPEDVKLAVAESRDLRPYSLDDFWWLSENDLYPRGWAAYQFHRPLQNDGYALFYRRPNSPYGALDVSLRGLAPDRSYRITVFREFLQDVTATLTGEQLQSLRMQIPDPGQSALLRYELANRPQQP